MNLEEIKKEENEIVFKVKCSKGTYIRTLCEDIAEAIRRNSAVCFGLERTKVRKIRFSG